MQSVVKMKKVIKVITTARDRRIKINATYESGGTWVALVCVVDSAISKLSMVMVIKINNVSLIQCHVIIVKLDLLEDKII